MKKKELLLYLDIPFCPVHCKHCDKPAVAPHPDLRQQYVHALWKEVQASAGSVDDYEVKAIWIGGDIAGHMFDDTLLRLLKQLRQWYSITDETEITLKVHPGMVSAETMKLCQQGKVTRLSIEYVTGNVFEYENLGRFLNPRAMDVTKMILAGQKQELSFDIIAGLPGQSEISLKESLQTVLDCGACHISLHPYESKADTALTKEWEQNGEQLQKNLRKHLPDAEELTRLLTMSSELLTQHGMVEYLPGQWALPGKECTYYVAEAASAECLAFGLGAESCLDGIRSWNTSDLSCYLQYAPDPSKIICRMEHFPG